MWFSQLSQRVLFANAAVVVMAILACSAIVAGWQEDQIFEQVQRRLRDSALLLRDSVGSELAVGDPSARQRKVREIGKQTETRFTLVDVSGKVVADSERPTLAAVSSMDDHAGREELVQAKQSGSGVSRRLSPTLKVPFLYYALRIDEQGSPIGYVRAAQPVSLILEEVTSLRRLIWLVGLGVGLAGLAVTFWLTRRIVNPIRALTEAAEQMAAGEAPQRLAITSHDEVGTLARAFENMVKRLGRREQSLSESIDRQSTVLSGMNEGVLAVDDQQRVLFANKAAGNLLGFIPEQVVGLTLLKVIRSNDLRELVQDVLRTNQPCDLDLDWQAEAEYKLDVRATPLPGEPCPGVVLVMHDITELKRLEGLRQQFVANVSHELKTPLSSIKAYTETLLGGAIEDKDNATRFLSRIDDQASRLHELIIDMLALARVEAGHTQLELSDISLSSVAGRCVADNEQRTASSDIRLINEIAGSDLSVRADREALRQIFDNLVDNALKYTPAGGLVTLSCQSRGEEAIFSVADTGPGIDSVHLERLFERFYRVDKARSRELGGTGLGLAIVKHLSEAMGGGASVESEIGQGTVISVRIPLSPD